MLGFGQPFLYYPAHWHWRTTKTQEVLLFFSKKAKYIFRYYLLRGQIKQEEKKVP